MTTEQPWPRPDSMDALLAAPTSHRVLLDNNRLRVLEVVIEPGTREPEHTHRAPSVMIIDEPARIRYHQGGTLLFESQAPPGPRPGVRVRWMEPGGPHSVENTDQHRYHAIRVELSNPAAHPEREPPAPGPAPGTKGTGITGTSKRDGNRLRRMGRTRTAAVGVARSGVCGSVWPGSAW